MPNADHVIEDQGEHLAGVEQVMETTVPVTEAEIEGMTDTQVADTNIC